MNKDFLLAAFNVFKKTVGKCSYLTHSSLKTLTWLGYPSFLKNYYLSAGINKSCNINKCKYIFSPVYITTFYFTSDNILFILVFSSFELGNPFLQVYELRRLYNIKRVMHF